MNDEGRYSNVSRRVWVDEKFCSLSVPKPNAQTLWLRLLTGPELGCIPGLFAARERGLADALKWPDAAFRKCWKEIADREMAFADWVAGLVWVPKSLDHNPPHSPNVVLSWKVSLKELPESTLKAKALASIEARLMVKGKPWLEAWRKASPQPSPNQEQEQYRSLGSDPDPISAHPTRARPLPADPFGDSLVGPDDELPADWAPDAANIALAAQLGLNLDDEAGEFAAHRRRNGFVCGNWPADFELWLRRSKKFARASQAARGAAPVPETTPAVQAARKASREATEAAVTERRRREVAERAGTSAATVEQAQAALADLNGGGSGQ